MRSGNAIYEGGFENRAMLRAGRWAAKIQSPPYNFSINLVGFKNTKPTLQFPKLLKKKLSLLPL
ncbi:MAG: hypothetical protein DRR16_19590 [Candidatus Parabeggiatoa sp. nov. 3]|nr:MAG: hypothetical protein DRR00_06640 [Gammaproteobacteria bacterium]RKZ66378.1 MAG: hypothetical protein DRQ99_09820 [Gammaproteobacteria bacterium]RKZ82462.1 MAG: hypothetical protein DRR16_19590 [Gammaproteobacteria bacterium]